MFIGSLSLLLFSCNKIDQPSASLEDMLTCHQKQNLDSTHVRAMLLGEWEWKFITYTWVENDNSKEFKNHIVKFMNNDSLEVYDNGVLTHSAKWEIKKTTGDLYQLEPDPGFSILYGRILLCNGQLVLNDSYRDGADQYFQRAD